MKTIKLRIALEITPNGEWQAAGSNFDDGDWNYAMTHCDPLPEAKKHWIEAEVPVPEEATAEVVAGNAVEVAA